MFLKQKIAVVWFTAVIVLLFLFEGAMVLAGESFNIAWWTVEGGGGLSQGGTFSINGTIGQSDTGTMVGEQYVLQSGFWITANPSNNLLFLPVVSNSTP